MAAENVEQSWWNHKVLEMHRSRLKQVKSTMNVKDASHVRSIDPRKRQFQKQEREAKIEYENKKLVSNMMEIVAKTGKEYKPQQPVKIYSRAETLRRKHGQEIARENYTLAMRIINQKPSMNLKKLEKDFHEHERIVHNRAVHTRTAQLVQQYGSVAESPRNRSPPSRPGQLEPLPEAQRRKETSLSLSLSKPTSSAASVLLSSGSPPRSRRNLAPISKSGGGVNRPSAAASTSVAAANEAAPAPEPLEQQE